MRLLVILLQIVCELDVDVVGARLVGCLHETAPNRRIIHAFSRTVQASDSEGRLAAGECCFTCCICSEQHAVFEQVTWKVVIGSIVRVGNDDSPVNGLGLDGSDSPHENDGDQTAWRRYTDDIHEAVDPPTAIEVVCCIHVNRIELADRNAALFSHFLGEVK